MIVTVTMNPAIDKTAVIDTFFYGGLNRIGNPVTDAGGKGINVSKTIKALGGNSVATGLLGKEGSDVILKCLSEAGITHDFILVEGTTRTNLKIMEKDGVLTEINEQGMTVSEENIQSLMEKLESYASKETIFVLAGSIPKGADSDIYARMIEKVKPKGAKVFVDADGLVLKKSLQAVPDMIKPNHTEIAEYFGLQKEASEEELVELGRRILEKGGGTLAISRGSKGAIFLSAEEHEVLCCEALPVEVHSAVGAGDAMVAAFAYAKERGMDFTESAKLSMAVSAGAAATVGTKPPDRARVDALLKQVKISRIV